MVNQEEEAHVNLLDALQEEEAQESPLNVLQVEEVEEAEEDLENK